VKPLYHRILITGANGLIGQALVKRLGRVPEVDLLATSRESAPRFGSMAGGYASLEITDREAIRRTFDDFAPTAVIHCAAMSRVDDCYADRDACWETNVLATDYLARTCKSFGSRLILVSTDFVFDGKDGPYAETARPNPVNFYGRTKLAAENAVRSAGLRKWTIIRTTLAFGAGENLRRGNFGTWLVDRLQAEQEAHVPIDQIRTPTYAPDLADGIARAVLLRKTGIYHVAGREIMSVFDLARQLARHFDFDPELIQPTKSDEIHADAPRPLLGGLLILKAESELGFRPRPLSVALDDFGMEMGLPVASP
jgi:dTDP-4-dehydrorhamnose reductase